MIAATFALDVASRYLWPEDVDPLIELGCKLLAADDIVDDATRRWYRASVAVFVRTRDDGRLVTRQAPGLPQGARVAAQASGGSRRARAGALSDGAALSAGRCRTAGGDDGFRAAARQRLGADGDPQQKGTGRSPTGSRRASSRAVRAVAGQSGTASRSRSADRLSAFHAERAGGRAHFLQPGARHARPIFSAIWRCSSLRVPLDRIEKKPDEAMTMYPPRVGRPAHRLAPALDDGRLGRNDDN